MHSAPKSLCYAMTSCTSHAYPGFTFFATVSKNCAHTVFFSVFIGRERSPLRKQLATDLELALNVSHCLCLRCGSALGYSVYPQSSAEHLIACVLLPLSSPTISRRKIKASGDEKKKTKKKSIKDRSFGGLFGLAGVAVSSMASSLDAGPGTCRCAIVGSRSHCPC